MITPQIYDLANGKTATGLCGLIVPVNADRLRVPVGIQLGGGAVATVQLMGTIATQQQINEGTAEWDVIQDAEWSSDGLYGLFVPYPFIQANISAYTSGNPTLKVWL